MIKMKTIQDAINAIDDVLNDHENHLFPRDFYALMVAKECLLIMAREGFK